MAVPEGEKGMAESTADPSAGVGGVALVTGASSGLGFQTARALAARGFHVLLAARHEGRAEGAEGRLRAFVPGASLERVSLDLASLSSVRSAARGIAERHAGLDVLVNNAAVMAVPFGLTEDGLELQLGVDHLGHFALTALLMPLLLRRPAARIVCVTSLARVLGGPLARRHLSSASGYQPWSAYGRAKLADLGFALELDRRLRAAGLATSALAADPGFSNTGLQAASARATGGLSQRAAYLLARRVGSTPAVGARPQVHAAVDPSAERGRLYGLRWVLGGPVVRWPTLSPWLDAERCARAWRLSEEATGIPFDVPALAAATAPRP
jgi:NAD(P)-dependent dehydrogenase (short-subunit alcohol dehydrogenase family)